MLDEFRFDEQRKLLSQKNAESVTKRYNFRYDSYFLTSKEVEELKK